MNPREILVRGPNWMGDLIMATPGAAMRRPAAGKTNLNLERVSVLSAEVAGRPCYLRDCPIEPRCTARVPAALVAAEGRRALEAGPGWQGVQRAVGGLAA